MKISSKPLPPEKKLLTSSDSASSLEFAPGFRQPSVPSFSHSSSSSRFEIVVFCFIVFHSSSASSPPSPPPFSLFLLSSSPPSMHSVASLNMDLNCFPLPQKRIPLCFSTSYGFRAPAVLNRVNEANGHRTRNGGGRGKEIQGTLRSSARLMIPPRSEEREVQVQMEEAKKAEFIRKMSAEQRKGRQQEEPKTKMKTKEKEEFHSSQVGTFDTRLTQASTERRRDMGIKGGGDIENEQQQTFYSFDNTLSSAKLHIENITASSTLATPSLIVPTHTIRIHESDVESTGIGADEVAVGEVVIPNGKAVRNILRVRKKRNEGQDVKVVIVIGVRGIRASIGCARSKRRLGELDGKEGLIDLGWDIGAPEKEFLSSEGVAQMKRMLRTETRIGGALAETMQSLKRSFSSVDISLT
ncbi:uncharacterized protein MONOS_16562 [Monocercomonoides exilis]|uniref:uncharacterized protein n=1 Tax=Monocercomonoides exilis TaxID=2049356 RepID=UPI00355A9098|nr:hypothetical protein MONOS_16562 [Monocercomonoides exilis]|eukprot:MONOS_16562.1-p1 / transcript=MONOS_16562.1 / gene=MONOS_16562 / organism=Monocercomonoides_exilis_PA203 / gene_product=unspecified product / transcript_product=unspecified product / location=Mono_scaffold01864:966-3080(-) / protein_length=412 / sequence_SO=supercontig / SO=protein_coding / is_pseudo=false